MVKKTKSLNHIDQIESNICALWNALHAEEKPLIISFGIDVVLQNKVIFVVLSLVDFV